MPTENLPNSLSSKTLPITTKQPLRKMARLSSLHHRRIIFFSSLAFRKVSAMRTSSGRPSESKETNARGAEGTIEFVRFFPHQVPQLELGMTGMLLDMPAFGSTEFEVKRGNTSQYTNVLYFT